MLESLLKLALIILLLIIIYRLKDRDCAEITPIFKNLKWDLFAAYKLFLPFQILLFFFHKLVIGKLPLYKLSATTLLVISWIPIIIFLLLFVVIIKRPFQVQWNSFGITLNSFTHKTIPILLFAGLILIIYVYNKGIDNIIVTRLSSIRIIFVVLMVVITSFMEELLFRGIMWRAFIRKMNTPVAALASSVFWGLWHYDTSLFGICGIIFYGLFLSWSYFKSKTILVPIAIHASYNIIKIIIWSQMVNTQA